MNELQKKQLIQQNEQSGEQYQEQSDRDDDRQETNQQGNNEQRKKKRKRRHKKKHPPEYYEEKKRLKQNLKRERQWDPRFGSGIPLFQPDDIKGSKSKLKLKTVKRRSQTKIGANIYHTFTGESQTKSKPSKSFNIRIMNKKQQKAENASKPQTIVQKQTNQKQNEQVQELVKLINKAYEQLQFSQCHKGILVDIIRRSKHKTIKSFVHAQIARLKSKTSCVSNLEILIRKRQNIISEFKASQQGINQQNVKKYRLHTLRVIQQILKWKEQLQASYLEQTGIKSKLVFTENGQNYLIKISKDLHARGLFEKCVRDPFLLGYLQQNLQHDLYVKIRACEMLLLEEQLDKS